MKSSQELFDFARERSKETFDKDGEHMPMFIIDGEECVVAGAPFRDQAEKEACIVGMKEIAKSIGATRVAMVLESWMVVVKNGEVDRSVPPSQHPDRIEVIFIVVRTNVPGEKDLSGYWRIRRLGRPRAVDFVEMPGEEHRGIFDAILPPKILH